MLVRKHVEFRFLQDDFWSEEGESSVGAEGERGVRGGDEDVVSLWCLCTECVIERR
jgi:hypothetical protein